jgi:hypothetical protein
MKNLWQRTQGGDEGDISPIGTARYALSANLAAVVGCSMRSFTIFARPLEANLVSLLGILRSLGPNARESPLSWRWCART